MKREIAILHASATVLILLIALSGCGNDGVVSRSAASADPAPVSTSVKVSIAENAVALGAGEAHQFKATVTGTTNTTVSWSVAGCSSSTCGTIDSNGYYTAPSTVPVVADVQVLATSQADPTKFDTVAVRHQPVSVSVNPPAVWMTPGATTTLLATVRYDIKKGGVSWALSCSEADCGTLNDVSGSSVVYKAPAEFPNPPTITITAASITDQAKTVRIMISPSGNDTLATGDYAFLFSGWELSISGGYYWPFRFTVAGHFRADGNGNILEGVEDINSIRGIAKAVPFTGSYAVGSDRQGVLTITTTDMTDTYRMALDPTGKKARFIRFDGVAPEMPVSGAGYLELQDKSAFSLTALKGDYAMGMQGGGAGHYWRIVDAVGRFSLGSDGALSRGQMDRITPDRSTSSNSPGSANFTLSGTLAGPSALTGRGTATFAIATAKDQTQKLLNFAYFVVSDDKLFLIQMDSRDDEDYSGSVLSGEVRRQHGTFTAASFNGPTIFSMAGLNREGYGAYYEHVEIGQMVADGTASIAGIVDDNGFPATNQAFRGSYTIASDGRAELQLGGDYLTSAVAYFYAANEAFLMESKPGTDVLFGNIRPQEGGPFDPASISGTFLTVTAPPTSEESTSECGLTTFDGESGVHSSFVTDENLNDNPQLWLGHFDLTGTYVVDPNGRGTITFPSQGTVVFWVIGPNQIVGNPAVTSAALLEFTR